VAHKQANRMLLAHLTDLPLEKAAFIAQSNSDLYRVDLSADAPPCPMWCRYDDPPDVWHDLSFPSGRPVDGTTHPGLRSR